MHVKSLRPVVKVISSSPPSSPSSLTAVWTSSIATSYCCEQRRPSVDFNRKWVRLSQRDIWRNYKPRCKPRVKGWVKSSYLASKKRYECQWSSFTRDQLSQGVGGVRACSCLWVCVIIRLRQGWWGACVIVKCALSVCVCLCWQGGRLGTGPCWLGSCSDTESDATRENRQVLCAGSLESRPWDMLPLHRHHDVARHTHAHTVHMYTHTIPVCTHAHIFYSVLSVPLNTLI